MVVAPGAPGAHRRAIGGAGIVGFGAAAVDTGGLAAGCEAAVIRQFFSRGNAVKPQLHRARCAADRSAVDGCGGRDGQLRDGANGPNPVIVAER